MDYLNRELEASINDLRAQPGVNPTGQHSFARCDWGEADADGRDARYKRNGRSVFGTAADGAKQCAIRCG